MSECGYEQSGMEMQMKEKIILLSGASPKKSPLIWPYE